MTEIPDEAIEAAAQAVYEHAKQQWEPMWDMKSDESRAVIRRHVRVVIESVLPAIEAAVRSEFGAYKPGPIEIHLTEAGWGGVEAVAEKARERDAFYRGKGIGL